MTAPISDTVVINITRDTVGISRTGFGTPLLLSYTTAWADRTRTYNSLADVAVDFPTTTCAEYLAAQSVFSQTPKPKQMKIGRGALPPTMVATISATARNSHPYTIGVAGDGVTATSISSTSDAAATVAEIHNALVTALNAVVGKNFTAAFAALVVADFTFTATAATDLLTATAHGLQTGDGPVQVSTTTTLPGGLAAATDYYAIYTDANNFQLATSRANALAGTAIDITSTGTGTHTLADTASTTRPANAFTVTGDAAGEWFSLEVDEDDLTYALTHSDPGIATDLAAIALADPDWYCLLTCYNSNAYVVAGAAWIEANTRLYFADVSNTLTVTATVGGAGNDIADNLATLAYDRTAVLYNARPASMLASGAAGRFLPTDPGSATLKFKKLAGITPSTLTATQRVNLRAKNANWLERSGGLNLIFDGTVASGDYVDVTRDLDYLKDDMQVRVFGALATSDKVDFDDDGIGIVEAEVRAALENAVRKRILKVDPAPEVIVPLVADISESDLGNRNLPDVKWSGSIRGSIHSVNSIDGTVTL